MTVVVFVKPWLVDEAYSLFNDVFIFFSKSPIVLVPFLLSGNVIPMPTVEFEYYFMDVFVSRLKAWSEITEQQVTIRRKGPSVFDLQVECVEATIRVKFKEEESEHQA